MFNINVLVLFVILGISWIQATSRVHVFHKNRNNFYNLEYTDIPEDRRPSQSNSSETMIREIYDYVTSPQDKYIELVTLSSFKFGQTEDFEDNERSKLFSDIKDASLESILRKPVEISNEYVLNITQIALNRVNESCKDLEEIVLPYIKHGIYGTPLERSESRGTNLLRDILQIIQFNIELTRCDLVNIQNDLDSFPKDIHDENDGKTRIRTILDYIVFLIRSIRGSWRDWKIIQNLKPEDIYGPPSDRL